jgi:hypothetical protein
VRILLAAAIGAVTILGVASAVLAYYNWNQKLAGQLISVLVVGTATAFVTVLLSLREVNEQRSFSTSFAVDTADRLPPLYQATDFSTRMMVRAYDLGRSSRPLVGDGDAKKPSVLPPAEDATFRFFNELLQYQIAFDIREIQQGVTSTLPVKDQEDFRVISARVRMPKEVTGVPLVRVTQWNAAIRTNRFSNRNGDDFWDRVFIAAPEGVQMELSTRPRYSDTDIEYLVRLFRPGYFDFVIAINTSVASTGGSIPDGLVIDEAVARRCATYHATVRMTLRVEKLTSGGDRSAAYRSWITEVADALEARWSDVGNTSSP